MELLFRLHLCSTLLYAHGHTDYSLHPVESLPLLSLLFRFFFSVKTNHKSFQQKCAEVREGVYAILMPNIVL